MFCRLCLKYSDTLHSIIESELKCAELTLIESLYWIFGVEVDVNDAYSKLICTRCENVVQYIGSYRTLYQGNQLILEDKLDSQSEYEEWMEQRNLTMMNEKEVLMDAEKNAELSLKAKTRRFEFIKYYSRFPTTALQELIGFQKLNEKYNDSEPLVDVNEVNVEVCKHCSRIFKTKGLLKCHYQTRHRLGGKVLKLKRGRKKKRSILAKVFKEKNIFTQGEGFSEKLINRCYSLNKSFDKDNRTKNFLFDVNDFPNLNFMKQLDKHENSSELHTPNKSKVPNIISQSSSESQEKDGTVSNNYNDDDTLNLKITVTNQNSENSRDFYIPLEKCVISKNNESNSIEAEDTLNVSQIDDLEEINKSNEDGDIINSEGESEPQLSDNDSEKIESDFLSKNKEKLSLLRDLCITIPRCDMPLEFEQGVFLDPNHKSNKPGIMKQWRSHISGTLFKLLRITTDDKEIRNTDVVPIEISKTLSKGNANIEIQSIKLSDNCISENDIRNQYKQLNLKDLCVSMKRCSVPKNFNLNSEILEQKNNEFGSTIEITELQQQSQNWKINFVNTFSKIKDINNQVNDMVTEEDSIERNLREKTITNCNNTPHKDLLNIVSRDLECSENKKKRKRQSDNDETQNPTTMEKLTVSIPRIDILLKKKKKYNIVDKTCKPRSKKYEQLVNIPQRKSLRKIQNTPPDCMPRLEKEIICKSSAPWLVPDKPPKLEPQVRKSPPAKAIKVARSKGNDYTINIKEGKSKTCNNVKYIGLVEDAANKDKNLINLKLKQCKAQRKKQESTVVSAEIAKEMENLIDSLKSVELKDRNIDNELSKNGSPLREDVKTPYHTNKEKRGGSKEYVKENDLIAEESFSDDESASKPEESVDKNNDSVDKELNIIDEEDDMGMWRKQISNILSRLNAETDDTTDGESTADYLDENEGSIEEVMGVAEDGNNTEKENPLNFKEKKIDNNSKYPEEVIAEHGTCLIAKSIESKSGNSDRSEVKSTSHYLDREDKNTESCKPSGNSVNNVPRNTDQNAINEEKKKGAWEKQISNILSRLQHIEEDDLTEPESIVEKERISDCLNADERIDSNSKFSGKSTAEDNKIEKKSTSDFNDKKERVDNLSKFSVEDINHDVCSIAKDVEDILEHNKLEEKSTPCHKGENVDNSKLSEEDVNKLPKVKDTVDKDKKEKEKEIWKNKTSNILFKLKHINEYVRIEHTEEESTQSYQDKEEVGDNSAVSVKDITEGDVFPMAKDMAGVPEDGNKIENENSSAFENKEKGIHDASLVPAEDHSIIEDQRTLHHHDKESDNVKNFKPQENVPIFLKDKDADKVDEKEENETWKKQIPNILSRLKQFEEDNVTDRKNYTEKERTSNCHNNEERVGNNTKFCEKNITEDVFPMTNVPDDDKIKRKNTGIGMDEDSHETMSKENIISNEGSNRLSKGSANIEIHGIKLSENCISENDVRSQYKQLNLKDLYISVKRCSIPKDTLSFENEGKCINDTHLIATDIINKHGNCNKIGSKSNPRSLDNESEIKNIKPEKNISNISKPKYFDTDDQEKGKGTWKKQIPNILNKLKHIEDDVTDITKDSTSNYQEERVGTNTKFSEEAVTEGNGDSDEGSHETTSLRNAVPTGFSNRLPKAQINIEIQRIRLSENCITETDIRSQYKQLNLKNLCISVKRCAVPRNTPGLENDGKCIDDTHLIAKHIADHEYNKIEDEINQLHLGNEGEIKNFKPSEKNITKVPEAKHSDRAENENKKRIWNKKIPNILGLLQQIEDVTNQKNTTEDSSSNYQDKEKNISDNTTFSEKPITKSSVSMTRDITGISEVPKIEDRSIMHHFDKEGENGKNSENDVSLLPKAKDQDTVPEEKEKKTWKKQIPSILNILKQIEEDDVTKQENLSKEESTPNCLVEAKERRVAYTSENFYKMEEDTSALEDKSVAEHDICLIANDVTSISKDCDKIEQRTPHHLDKRDENIKIFKPSEKDVCKFPEAKNLDVVDKGDEKGIWRDQIPNVLLTLQQIETDVTEQENIAEVETTHNRENETDNNFKSFEKGVRENESDVAVKESISEGRNKESENGKNSSEDVGENDNGSKPDLDTIDEEENLKTWKNEVSKTLDNVTKIPENVKKEIIKKEKGNDIDAFQNVIRSRWSNITKGQIITQSDTSNPSSSSDALQYVEDDIVKKQ